MRVGNSGRKMFHRIYLCLFSKTAQVIFQMMSFKILRINGPEIIRSVPVRITTASIPEKIALYCSLQ